MRAPVNEFASVATIVKPNVPNTVGVPDKLPPDESVMPVGNDPELIAYVYDAVPPLAVIACEYAEFTVPLVSDDGATVITGAMTSVYARAPVYAFASVAVMVKLKVPNTVGVPDNVPPEERDMPVGSAPEVTAYVYDAVPPLAVIA